MKILLLNDYGTATGGAEFQVLAMRDGLRRRGHDARLLASRAIYTEGEIVADYLCHGTTSRLQPLVMTANVSAYRALRSALREFRPDIVHLNMFMWQLSPLILPLLRDVPTVYHVQMYNPICPRGTKMLPDGTPCRDRAGFACRRNGCFSYHAWSAVMLQMKLWRRWIDHVDEIVSISEPLRSRLAADGIASRHVVWNGVPAITQPVTPRTPFPTVVFAGRLVPEKGVDILLHAFARARRVVPDARLIIAGEGAERESLLALAHELGLDDSISMLGFVERDELDRLFASAWAQAVPGRWEEPFGMVSTEAMMRATPVVASASGGQLDIVVDGVTGYLVPPGDVDALTERLTRLLRDRDLVEKMGAAGRARAVERFSEDASVDAFVEIYRKLLAR